MKKTIVILSSFLLVGAGCLNLYGTVETETAPPAKMNAGSGTQIEVEVDAEVEADAGADAGADVGAEVDITLEETMNMSMGNFYFRPNTISATPGQTVNVKVGSADGTHTFVIDGVTKQTVRADGTITFSAPTTPGEYPFYCDVGSHRANGMSGTLFVE